MARHTDDADRTDYVNKHVERAIESYDVDAEFDGATVIGHDDDAYVSATVVFDPETTARDVARVRRTLPMSLDRTIDFRGGDTLLLRVRLE